MTFPATAAFHPLSVRRRFDHTGNTGLCGSSRGSISPVIECEARPIWPARVFHVQAEADINLWVTDCQLDQFVLVVVPHTGQVCVVFSAVGLSFIPCLLFLYEDIVVDGGGCPIWKNFLSHEQNQQQNKMNRYWRFKMYLVSIYLQSLENVIHLIGSKYNNFVGLWNYLFI